MCQSNQSEALKLWSKMPQYKRKLERTNDLISEMLRVVSRPYIALSCGKDSSAMAHMINQHNPSIPMRFVSRGETRFLYENIDCVLDYFRSIGTVEEILFDRLFSDEWKSADFWTVENASKMDTRGLDSSDYDGVFLGIRKDESEGRRNSLKFHHTYGMPRYCYKYKNKNIVRMCPVADWNFKDIGAYLVTHEIPVLDWYENMGFEARTATRINGRAIENGNIKWLHIHNPSGYYKLIQRFPELKIYE